MFYFPAELGSLTLYFSLGDCKTIVRTLSKRIIFYVTHKYVYMQREKGLHLKTVMTYLE